MRRCVLGLALIFCVVGGQTAPAPALAPLVITFAEQPVRLARDTTFYNASRGTALQVNDLIDSGRATILLGANGSTIALGPDTQLFVKSLTELILLKGWLKVNGARAQGPLCATALLQFDSSGAIVTLQAGPGTSALFAESRELLVTELSNGKILRSTRLPREQFGAKNGMLPLALAPHPPPAFLAGMPRTFLDALVTVAVSGAAAPPQRERAATYAELAPLLAEHPLLRTQVQRRFQPSAPRGPRARIPNELF